MRILVVSRSGVREVLTLVAPVTIHESNDPNGMSTLRSADGMDHWFNEVDGTYDGWGRGTSLSSDKDTNEMITRIESEREFPDARAGTETS